MDYLDRLDSIQAREVETQKADEKAAWLLEIQGRILENWHQLDLEDAAADVGALLEADLTPAVGWRRIGHLLRRLVNYRGGE